MLDPEYILHLTEGAEQIASELHENIIAQIVKRIMIRLGRGDEYILTPQDKHQLEVLQEAGFLSEDIQAEIARSTQLELEEMVQAFEDAGVRALAYDNEVYERAGLSAKPLRQSPHLIRLMQRNYEATAREWRNYTRTTANAAQRVFIRECDKAYNLVSSGAMSYTQAVRDAVETIASDGVTVTYPSGHTDTIETATLRAVRTGVNQACSEITKARMDELGWDIVLVSAHIGARVTPRDDYTNHSWWQGKFYSLSGEDPRFPPYSVCGDGDVQGIHGANCRHSMGPGDGENNPYDGLIDSEENRKAYELSQRQRALERRIRKTKREVMALKTAADNAEDPAVKAELEQAYQKKALLLQKQNKAYDDFCKENNLKPLQERLSIAKWDREKAAAATQAANKEIHKYDKIRYNKNGTVVVTDDWKNRAGSSVPREYKPNAVIETKRVFRNGQTQIDRSIYNTGGKLWKQIHSGPHSRPDLHHYGEHGEHLHEYLWGADGSFISRKTTELSDEDRKAHADILEVSDNA